MIRFLRGSVLAAIPLVLLAVPLIAQRSQQRTNGTEIQVHITYENSQPVDLQLRVDLTNGSGIVVTQAFTTNEGRVNFRVSSEGIYLVKVSGTDIEDGASESVEVDPLDSVRVVFVRVRRKAEAAGAQSSASSPNVRMTSAAELRAPQNARKAFDQGMTAWQKKDYQQAAEKFEKAVADYPEYDTAYNNLGVMYAHLNQPDKAIAAFKRSVELNDKNADADRNLARMLMRNKEYPQAEELLKKALTVQPPDAPTLTMLAIAEIQDGKPDDALRDAQQVHAFPHDGYAVVHYVAGEALEEKNQFAKASAEYALYLKESPNGAEAVQVKSAMARLSSSTASAAPRSQ